MPTVALVQRPPVFLDLPASVALAAEIIGEVARGGADLVVFPETWLPGYPVWLDDAPDAARWGHAPAEALFRHLFQHSPAIDGPELATLAAAAAEHGADVAMGMHERRGGTLYNSIAFLGADGSRHLHRKLSPTYNERLIWGSGDGSTLGVWDRPYGKVGGLVCWEHWMPLVRAAMHAQEETVHVAQWPAVGERHQLASRTYAFEGQCFVLASGCVLTRDDVLAGFDSARAPRAPRARPAGLHSSGQVLAEGGRQRGDRTRRRLRRGPELPRRGDRDGQLRPGRGEAQPLPRRPWPLRATRHLRAARRHDPTGGGQVRRMAAGLIAASAVRRDGSAGRRLRGDDRRHLAGDLLQSRRHARRLGRLAGAIRRVAAGQVLPPGSHRAKVRHGPDP